MDFGRSYGVLTPVTEDLHHLAPVPIIYQGLDIPDLDSFNLNLMNIARESLTEPEVEVPDVRHHDDMGYQFEFDDDVWSETQIPAIGVWHGVPPIRSWTTPRSRSPGSGRSSRIATDSR